LKKQHLTLPEIKARLAGSRRESAHAEVKGNPCHAAVWAFFATIASSLPYTCLCTGVLKWRRRYILYAPSVKLFFNTYLCELQTSLNVKLSLQCQPSC